MASTFASAGNKPTKPYWQEVQVVAVNKEYPRSFLRIEYHSFPCTATEKRAC